MLHSFIEKDVLIILLKEKLYNMDNCEKMPIRENIEVLPADHDGLKLGFVIYEQMGPIGCSQDIWDSMSKEEQDAWNEMNRKIIERNKAAREKFMKENRITEDDVIPID